MSRLFVSIYMFLSKRKWLRHTLMFGSFMLMLSLGLQLRFEEEFTRFFPDNESAANSELVFNNLRIKDKIIVMISARDTTRTEELLDTIVAAGDSMAKQISAGRANDYLSGILSEVSNTTVEQTTDFVYSRLPVFLTEADYHRLDTLLVPEAIDRRMRQNFINLMSPSGIALKSTVVRDPLGLAGSVMLGLKAFEQLSDYEIYDNRIFSPDLSTMLLILSPKYGTGETGKNDVLISELEQERHRIETRYPDVRVQFFGGPSVAVYNARQVKKDTALTLGIALLIIIIFMLLMFKSRRAIPLLLTPVIYGGVFSLAVIFLIKGSISAIAIGVGAVVLGIALSYSIHVITHFGHVRDSRQLVEELAYPLVVGGFTTIGAFLSLLFTSSDMLRDFGLFSALTLVGTTLFCLIFLPHLLGEKKHGVTSPGKVLQQVERLAAYPFEKNKLLLGFIGLLFVAGLIAMRHVGFDNNMSNLNYEPPTIKAAEQQMNRLFLKDEKQQIMFVSVGKTTDEALHNYATNNQKLDSLQQAGDIGGVVSAELFALSAVVQQQRIERWNAFWTDEKKQALQTNIRSSAAKYGFAPDTFEPFFALLNQSFSPFPIETLGAHIPFLADWMVKDGDTLMCITQVQLSVAQKEEVYRLMATNNPNLVIFDRGFFTNQWVSAIHVDFNTILYLSSIIIFLALLISYGRFELTLMAFAPMAVSWVIILGLMAVLGIEFNIINIILSTFIFGLGDDFAIFMMDGMQQEYRTGKTITHSHKTAILFSAFTATVGMGVLIFAKHPALQSISLVSVVGMTSVLLVSYTVIPVLFRALIIAPARKGNHPYTLVSLANTTFTYLLFVSGSFVLFTFRLLLFIVPVSGKRKKAIFSHAIMYFMRVFVFLCFYAKKSVINPTGERFEQPAVIVANHQSMIDILLMLSLAPKIILVTNRWVWHSPVFGHVVRYAGFIPAQKGFEQMLRMLRERVAEGYSVVVFPEGTRSIDGKIKRFHKGAFMLAERLHLDIIPAALYGTGNLLNKKQMYYIKPGTVAISLLPRIQHQTLTRYDGSMHKAAKAIGDMVRAEYNRLCHLYSRPENAYFRHKLTANYVYKGPVEEWYVRVKAAMEHFYSYFESIIPRKATVIDIGCGYGMLSYMLANTSDQRHVLGIDYDQDKTALANHNFAKTERIRFLCADALAFNYPNADVFVINDVLHYMNYTDQTTLLQKCIEKLNPNGMIIVRDSDADKTKQHKITRFTELISTRLLKFNKTTNQLQFPTATQFLHFAERNNLHVEQKINDKYTSNHVFIFTRKMEL